MANSPFGDDFGNIFDKAMKDAKAKNRINEPTEKGIPWQAKVIDGKYYVPLEQVSELLKTNDVLPRVRAGIDRRVEAGPPK